MSSGEIDEISELFDGTDIDDHVTEPNNNDAPYRPSSLATPSTTDRPRLSPTSKQRKKLFIDGRMNSRSQEAVHGCDAMDDNADVSLTCTIQLSVALIDYMTKKRVELKVGFVPLSENEPDLFDAERGNDDEEWSQPSSSRPHKSSREFDQETTTVKREIKGRISPSFARKNAAISAKQHHGPGSNSEQITASAEKDTKPEQ